MRDQGTQVDVTIGEEEKLLMFSYCTVKGCRSTTRTVYLKIATRGFLKNVSPQRDTAGDIHTLIIQIPTYTGVYSSKHNLFL